MQSIGFLSHLDYNLWLFRLPVMQELIRLGHTVYAICPEGEVSGRFAEHKIIHVPYAIERSSLNPLKEVRAIQNIYSAILPLNLDLLHTFTAKPNIYGTIAAHLAKVPRIINLVEGLGSFYLEDDPKSRLVRSMIETLYRQCFKFSERVMFVNRDDPEYLISRGVIKADKVFVIKGVGIDTREWKNPYTKKSLPLVVTMIARAIRHKGVFEFAAAADTLTREYPDVEFRYIGTPDPGNRFSVDDHFFADHPSITYLGHRNDIKEQLSDTDVFVLPSYREGLPRTSMEALSMALPIVTTDVVGCRETVDHGVNGLIVPPRDPDALTEAIRSLLNDGALRASMGKASRTKAVNEFDIDTIVSKHLEVYGLHRVR